MIKVKAYLHPSFGFEGMEISGHAKYAEYGKDIICAGVSALVETAILGLEKIACLEPKIVKKSGYVSIIIPEDSLEDSLQKANIILETIYLGLEDMSKSYPDNIRTEKLGRCSN